MNIAIIEDDASVRIGLKRMLSGWNFTVSEFADGQTAWDHLQTTQQPPLMLLLDRVLPGIDGMELCRRARVHPHLRHAYIIFLTVRNQAQDVIDGLEAGADDYVTKPFNADELKARVQTGVRLLEAYEERLSLERMRVLLETTGAAAHEINQPLTVILGRAERLRDRLADDEPARREVEAIITSVERIHELVTSMGGVQRYVTKPYTLNFNILDFKQANEPASHSANES